MVEDADPNSTFKQKILGTEVRVILSDSRVVEGILECMDKDMNFIIGSAIELHGLKNGKSAQRNRPLLPGTWVLL